MRKNSLLCLLAIALAGVHSACFKNLENTMDCFAESTTVSLTATHGPVNSTVMNFEVQYTGSNRVTKVEWTFGDGSTSTVNSTTTSHIYTHTGNFSVKANVEVTRSNLYCTIEKIKDITVK